MVSPAIHVQTRSQNLWTKSLRAPSYFSHFFEEQLRHNENGAAVRTLYIDRDPANFRDILRHLQGIWVLLPRVLLSIIETLICMYFTWHD